MHLKNIHTNTKIDALYSASQLMPGARANPSANRAFVDRLLDPADASSFSQTFQVRKNLDVVETMALLLDIICKPATK